MQVASTWQAMGQGHCGCLNLLSHVWPQHCTVDAYTSCLMGQLDLHTTGAPMSVA